MSGRTEVYSVQAQDGTVVYGIPPGLEPTDPQVKKTLDLARERGEKEIAFPYMTEKEIGRGIVAGGKRIGLNLAEMVGLVEPETVEAFEAEQAMQPRSMGRSAAQLGTELLGTAVPAAGTVSLGLRGVRAIPKVKEALSAVPGALGLAGRGTAEGSLEGAVLAGPGERLPGAGVGAAWGGGVGGGFGLLTQGFRTPDEAAQKLLDMGVDLTPGQMKPQGFMNYLEQLTSDLPFGQATAGAARKNAQASFAHAMVNQARPPGASAVPQSAFHEMVSRLGDQFNTAYEVGKGYPVYRGWDDYLGDQFKRITQRPDYLVDESQRGIIDNYLQTKLSATKRKAEKNQGLVDSGDLLDLRSVIRTRERQGRLKNENSDMMDMLEAADAAITQELTKQLPPEVMPYVRRVDRQYAKYKIVEDASAANKWEGPPTPYQWASATHRSATKRQKATKEGFFMPEAMAAGQVFETTAPRTGARNLMAGAIGLGGPVGMYSAPMVGVPLAAAAMVGAGTRTGRQAAIGQLPIQQGVLDLINQAPPYTMSTLGSIARASPVVYGQQPEY